MRMLRRIVLALIFFGILMHFLMPRGSVEIAQGTILELGLEGMYVETPEPTLAARLLGDGARPFISVLSEFSKAERDDRIETVILAIGHLEIGWAKAAELRAAIERLSSQGKRTVAYLELASFGANLEYFVASAADEVILAPAARTPVIGLAGEFMFLGGLWEKLGLEIEVERIGRYKSAAETFAGRKMSEPTREMQNALLDSIDRVFVSAIAEGRGLGESTVRDAIAATPVDPEGMQKWGLIDGVLHRDELYEFVGTGEVIDSAEYSFVTPEDVGFDPVARFALIYGTGNVVGGEGTVSPDGTPVLAADTVSEAIADAAEDDDIDAIIFRIDSPGGSPLASDIVWRASQLARGFDKPFVASFSDVAASGGYYVATGADAIVASPTSITGSIGVFVLRPVIGGALDKLDIGHETLVRGPHADLGLSTQRLSESSRERLEAEVASIYELFLERVSDGRGLERDAVDAVAQGRVWTGEQAAQQGLVDVLGGLREAVNEGKRRIELDADADVALVLFPPPQSFADQVAELLDGVRGVGSFPVPLPDAWRDARVWLDSMVEGTPLALLPFSIDIH